MKKLTYSLLISAFVFTLFSCTKDSNSGDENDNPFNGDVVLSSQLEVNEFGENGHAGVQGNLSISINSTVGSTNITDLSPLSSLTFIDGDLTINSNNELTSLQGLNNITSIGGRLGIIQNDQLQNIDALGNLENLGLELVVINCKNLNNLNGLLNLTTVNGFMHIGDVNTDLSNEALLSLNGLSNITSVNGNIIIANNESITDLSGLENITRINGEFRIFGNDNLQNVNGLQNIDIVAGDFTIYGNHNLQNLNQLNSLNNIEGFLDVSFNNSLANLSGFQNLESIGTFLNLSLEFTNVIEAENFQNLTSVPHITISATEIDSFNSLEDVTSIRIIGNEKILSKLSGFQGLSSMETLEIKNVFEINAFQNLQSVTILLMEQPVFNDPVIAITGLSNLTAISNTLTIDSIANQNLDFLNGLTSVENISIQYCENLTDFCSLNSLFQNGTVGSFFAGNNLFNPSYKDMENGNCSL